MVDYKMVDGNTIQLTQQEQAVHDAAIAAAPALAATQVLLSSAMSALAQSDRTMVRIQEAVSLGLTTFTTADVVAWVTYRRALRAIIDSSTGSLPTKPPYPANT